MNKLSKKFIAWITVILCIACVSAVVFNTVLLEKYYLYQKRMSLSSVCGDLEELVRNGASAEEAAARMEESEKVIIVRIENFSEKDNDTVNDEIRRAFQNNGVGFQKYWLWKGDQNGILNGETRTRLYEQEKLNYSLLSEYMLIGSTAYVVTMIIPDISDAFGIINSFLVGVNAVCIAVSVLFIILLVKRITKPLSEFKMFAANMEKNEFIPLQVQTNDELENVADLDNAAHDLKTPVSLIRLYAGGIKDGLDDGTFLDTILDETEQMSDMVNRLLYISGLEKKEYKKTSINLTELFEGVVNKYSIMAEENHQEIHAELERDITVTASEELITTVLINLITNALKYSSGREIRVKLQKETGRIVFSVSNETENNALDISRIWEPYYVGEKSRNKSLSGTGLGLSIVRKICETQHYAAECSLQEKHIIFTVAIPV